MFQAVLANSRHHHPKCTGESRPYLLAHDLCHRAKEHDRQQVATQREAQRVEPELIDETLEFGCQNKAKQEQAGDGAGGKVWLSTAERCLTNAHVALEKFLPWLSQNKRAVP